MPTTLPFSDLLAQAISRVGSPVCVGLDPVLESLPAEVRARHPEPLAAISDFSHGVLREIAPIVPAVKFQSACFERYGSKGFAVLEECAAEAARLGLVIVWDAKRGDISTTAAHYAAAAKNLPAHVVTVNGYLGRSGIQPFLDAGLGVFILVRTSNPDSDAVQAHRLADGRSIAEMMADDVANFGREHRGSCGLTNIGAVVGATKSGEAKALRARMPDTIFLIPGYGAQGGKAEDIRDMIRPSASKGCEGVLVTASRSVIYAAGTTDWRRSVRDAASSLAAEIASIIR
jgi:orotidine-5'-phosphate decarboxylase